MEEIDLKELFTFFLSKIGLLLVIVSGVCMLGCLYSIFFQKPMYNSYTTVILSSAETTITTNDITLNKNLVDTYAEIVKSKRVLNQVIATLDLDVKYEALAESIGVSAVNDTEIIKITVNNSDPVDAKDIANATANIFTKEVTNLYNMDNVNVLDEAETKEEPYNINIPKQIIIYILIGGVLGVGVLFIIYYFDRTIKSIEQVEQKIKLPILGSVREYGRSSK